MLIRTPHVGKLDEGAGVGAEIGLAVGFAVGFAVGSAVGSAVGLKYCSPTLFATISTGLD